MSTSKLYPETTAKPDFVKLEENVLEFWNTKKIFEKSVSQRDGAEEFVFYDGPPFANGLPHYGHVLQSYNKDTVGRYFTMRGFRVGRRWGWDCHGLPPELKTEKELGISGKAEIIKYGIDKFIEKCRDDVLTYAEDWKSIVNRMGRWADMDNAYKTMDTPYSESIMWAFKALYEKGLVYEDYRVLPYSWAAETVLSNFEVNLAYKEKTDPAITVKFKLNNGFTLLVWTTTPWTLPSNMMLAVGPEIEYSVFEKDGEKLVLATSRVEAFRKELGDAKLCEIKLGKELVGLEYTPLFPYFAKRHAKVHQVLGAEFVAENDGTGIVHIAPGFGEEDFAACKKFAADFPVICPVDGAGRFTDEVSDYTGLQVFEANDDITALLKTKGILFKKDQITHEYPYCWRTDKPLIYKAMSSWFVKVVDIKKLLLDNNQTVNWIPEHIKDGRFGKWLDGARDWSISRNRFWGAPIPVWKSESGKYIEVIGSIAELEEKSGKKATDLHRPYIDSFTWAAPDGTAMRRVEDVFDCWFESGSMPFASVHYPFENKEWFESHCQADFIAEAVDQTRGWFYTMAVLGTALYGKIPYKNCNVTGLVFDDKKQKLSKKLGNYSEPTEFFNKYGSDAFRWFLLSSPLLKGEIACISKEGSEIAVQARRSTIPFYNAYHFFTLYANADGIKAKYSLNKTDTIDRYILAELANLKVIALKSMDNFDIATFCKKAEEFLETLNNWYIRLSRERFWGTGVAKESQQDAFDTLYTVLVDFAKLAAPILPFTADFIYKNLTGEESVHLADYPKTGAADEEILSSMNLVRQVCIAAKNIREDRGIKNRQPLASLTIASNKADVIKSYANIIMTECNIDEVKFDEDLKKYAKETLYIFTPIVGKRLGKGLAEVQKLAVSDSSAAIKLLKDGEYEMRLAILDGIDGKATSDNDAVVLLDTDITEELREKGVFRDFLRAVQEERKARGFDVSDRIAITYTGGLEKFHGDIAKVALALEITVAAKAEGFVNAPETDVWFDLRKV